MKSKVLSATLQGVDAKIVEVEVDLITSLPQFTTVGLAEGAVKESKERVRSALKNSGYSFPSKRITVNLAPADIPKHGTLYDLPIAVGILSEMGYVSSSILSKYIIVGELSLDGKVRSVKGVLSMACEALSQGLKGIVLPVENVFEAGVVNNIDVIGVKDLKETIDFFNEIKKIEPTKSNLSTLFFDDEIDILDYEDVLGHLSIKRALEVAASGGHNVLMLGPPGSGKTMLAKRFPSILPPLTFEEALSATKVYSVSGLLGSGQALMRKRPFRSPHHTISEAGLIGGGSYPMPGEISLSHCGVLFLDELPEFRRQTLEVMRQPLEEGYVTISRVRRSVTYPAKFMLIATMNPCPCGFLGSRTHECKCSEFEIHKYRTRLSGPLLDRIDIQIEVPVIPHSDLFKNTLAEKSNQIRKRVVLARKVQTNRYSTHRKDINGLEQNFNEAVFCNAQMTPQQIRIYADLTNESKKILERAIDRLGLSTRAYARILKVSRTIADMESSNNILPYHITEAIHYRCLDRKKQNTIHSSEMSL